MERTSSADGGRESLVDKAYREIRQRILDNVYPAGHRALEQEYADELGLSRTPVREALQRLETQSMLTRDGRSLIVASLDHNQLSELYVVRTELEGLAARLAARHASDEEIRVLRGMVTDDLKLLGGDPARTPLGRLAAQTMAEVWPLHSGELAWLAGDLLWTAAVPTPPAA